MRKMIDSFRYAFTGLKMLIRSERNFKIHILATFMVIAAGFLLKLTTCEWIAIAFAIGFVLAAEAFNSALEKLCDVVHPAHSEGVKKVKDMAAGAVLIAAITAVAVAALIVL
ncbi:diacylglycerol kinase family protein [Bacteroidales bacterium OttesenSCG-928-C03]|nr:diacylglycerol kinase family protein [Bacteroidales bacterium OttesenSCG-928-C03]